MMASALGLSAPSPVVPEAAEVYGQDEDASHHDRTAPAKRGDARLVVLERSGDVPLHHSFQASSPLPLQCVDLTHTAQIFAQSGLTLFSSGQMEVRIGTINASTAGWLPQGLENTLARATNSDAFTFQGAAWRPRWCAHV